MALLFRTVLLAAALLSSGALPLVAAAVDDACCAGEAEEKEASCCPPGLACACCPMRGAVEAAAEVAPAPSRGVAIAVVTAEPSLGAPVTDIFQPPRA